MCTTVTLVLNEKKTIILINFMYLYIYINPIIYFINQKVEHPIYKAYIPKQSNSLCQSHCITVTDNHHCCSSLTRYSSLSIVKRGNTASRSAMPLQ